MEMYVLQKSYSMHYKVRFFTVILLKVTFYNEMFF